jgi:hypothetical protein
MSLVTLADIKAYMGITGTSEDALLTIFQDAVEQQVLNFCEVVFTPTVVTNEIHDGSRADIILPKNVPIRSVEAVIFDVAVDGSGGTTLVAATDYYIDDNAITLRNHVTPFYRGNVRLDYTHGYATTPADIKLAIYEAVKANYQRKKNNREDIGSRRKQDEAESYTSAWDPKTGLPSNVVAKLQTYRVFEFPNINWAQRNS